VITASVLALASISASAGEMTVGGVTWDPDYQSFGGTDFLSAGYFTQWYTAPPGSTPTSIDGAVVPPGTVGAVLQGVGEIQGFNGRTATTTPFVCATCELTFSFGGLVFDNDLTDGSLFDLTASQTSGFFNIYFDDDLTDGTDFDAYNISSAADASKAIDGELFLGLSFNILKEGAGFTVTNGTIDSLWDVTGGSAAYHFDTNSDLFGTDLRFNATTFFQGLTAASVGIATGNTIPEPTSLAIFGLGLLGLAGASKRRKKA